MSKPKLLTTPKLDGLRSVCEAYLKEIEDGEEDTDTKHYIFEAAMEAFYGKGVWDYINSSEEEV